MGGLDDADVKEATLLLWKGHCSVHQRFRPEHVEAFRAEHPDGLVFIHPECAHEVVEMADEVGSTDFIIRAVDEAPAGSVIGVGTEIHLVKRLDDEHPDKTVVSLDPLVCPCSTMFRIDAAHLCWVLERLVEGEVVNRITVDDDTAHWARLALRAHARHHLTPSPQHGHRRAATEAAVRRVSRRRGARRPGRGRRAIPRTTAHRPPGAKRSTHRSRHGVSGSLSYSTHTWTTAVSASTATTSLDMVKSSSAPSRSDVPERRQLVEAPHGLGPRRRGVGHVGGEELGQPVGAGRAPRWRRMCCTRSAWRCIRCSWRQCRWR